MLNLYIWSQILCKMVLTLLIPLQSADIATIDDELDTISCITGKVVNYRGVTIKNFDRKAMSLYQLACKVVEKLSPRVVSGEGDGVHVIKNQVFLVSHEFQGVSVKYRDTTFFKRNFEGTDAQAALVFHYLLMFKSLAKIDKKTASSVMEMLV